MMHPGRAFAGGFGNPARVPEIRELFQVIDARLWDKLPRFFASDIVYERPGYDPLVGLEQLLNFYRNVRVIASGAHSLEKLVLDDTSGACWGRFVGLHKDGSVIDERFADVYTFHDGRIATRRSYFFRPAV